MPSHPPVEQTRKPAVTQTTWRDIPFDNLTPGQVWHTQYELEADTVQGFYSLVGHRPTSSTSAGNDADAPVSPMVFSTFTPMFRAMGGRMEQGTIQTHQSIEVHHVPAYVGDVLDVETRLTQAEVDGHRHRVEVEIVFTLAGAPVCTTRSRYLWGYSRPKETR